MEKSEKPATYEFERLPNDQWQERGEALVLAEAVRHELVRCGLYRLRYGDGSYGLFTLNGPPGVGKSDTVRWAGDAAIRAFGGIGNALVIETPALLSDHLGKSQQICAKLMKDIALSGAKRPTVVIWDDAEGIFASRRMSMKNGDPSDLLRVTAALAKGFDDLRGVKNVLMYATCNLPEMIDEAIFTRGDHVIHFRLPTFAERLAILRHVVKGLAGERVVWELAEATEGWSGRELAKITFKAYVVSNADRREELTPEDFLRAVRITPGNGNVMAHGNGNGASTPKEASAAMAEREMVEEAAMVAATVTNGKEDEVCQNGQKASSRSVSQQAPSPPQTRSDAPVSWFERLQRCSTWPPLPPC